MKRRTRAVIKDGLDPGDHAKEFASEPLAKEDNRL
jgi:hypothetical protein